ncbi:hypothetical protein [Mycobacterium sp.]|uniref:hypothetical protein n=1 Tax=Mycobacterium sp. TaxID=1785 RepID=UPI002C56B774|nr:hypothetical protein [Mycobacterium sp.]HTY35127.1 hypothetical protein [Mycobacterium sp.]
MSTWTSERARIAALKRGIRAGERPADDPALTEAYRNLRAERLAEHVATVVAGFPKLTDEQLNRVAAILHAGAQNGAA